MRQFPAVEVRELVHDLRSSQTVHVVPGSVLRDFPIDRLADVLALQPGVVAEGEELHVRGGRSGETSVNLDGLRINEPLLHRALEVPLLALRDAELVSGTPDAQFGGGIAGTVNLRTIAPSERFSLEPTARFSSEWRWETDGRLGTHYDRAALRVSAPLAFGLAMVTSGDATLDDTWIPALRTVSRRRIAGMSFGWRAENRLNGFLKLAPVANPERFSAEVLVNRQVHRPYNPSFTVDGWMLVPANLKLSPIYSPVPLPGYLRYRAADHLGFTDDHQLAALVRVGSTSPTRRAGLGLGWLRTRTLTSVGGHRESESASHRPRYGSPLDRDRFHVLWGDDPVYRESGSDVVTLQGDAETIVRTGRMKAGFGVSYEDVSMLEMDWMPFAIRAGEEGFPFPVDSIRKYRAQAPGGFAYVQGRWLSGGMILNAGLRAEYFTAGRDARMQTLAGDGSVLWSLAPRLGIAYPISVRDVFSLAYVRVHQSPGRDYLYDQRIAISDRQPLGNPELRPAEMISYQAAVKHLFDAQWALQTSLFYRDVFGQIGALDYEIPQGPINLRFTDQDESHAAGFELSVIHAEGEHHRVEAHYTWLTAWGNESRPGGDPYGPVRSARVPAITDRPLSWDRRHTFVLAGSWDWKSRLSASWSTALRSPPPWTPKPKREPITDLSVVDSRRLEWSENTDARLEWTPPRAFGLTLGLEVRNLFDDRSERAATLDGYPNPVINTLYDDYGAYRTETGQGGGGYWSLVEGRWIPVHDPRLANPPRAVRASVGARW